MKRRRMPNRPPLFPGMPGWDPRWKIAVRKTRNAWYIEVVGGGEIPIGEITLTPSAYVRGGWQVTHIRVDNRHEGKGLGQALYLLALKLADRVHPDWDNSVSESAMRTWAALLRKKLIHGLPYAGFAKAKITDPKHIRLERDMPRMEFTAVDDVIQLPGRSKRDSIVFPKGWRGILDQVYWLSDPDSVPLVEITRE